MLKVSSEFKDGFETGNIVSGRHLLGKYMEKRKEAMDVRFENNDLLVDIQESTRQWIESTFDIDQINYEEFSSEVVKHKMLGLSKFLKENFSNIVSDEEHEATELFIKSSFEMYREFEGLDKQSQHEDSDGSFAFVVPMRVSRFRKDYGHEVEMISPLLRYIPNEYRAMFAVGLPPLILDQYEVDDTGKRGYLVLAPIYTDSITDIPDKALDVAVDNINEAVDFAYHRLGSKIVGLGAVLPAFTRFGSSIKNPNVITTTGHAGTVFEIDQSIREAFSRGFVSEDALRRIGVLGQGSIGLSATKIIASNFPNSEINIYDSKDIPLNRGIKSLTDMQREHKVCSSEEDLLQSSDIIVSAITGQVNLTDKDIDLNNKFIIDDSQPGSFDRLQVEERGGRVAWVIAHSTNGMTTRMGYDYGTLADGEKDFFGCEAEAACLARYSDELQKRGLGGQLADRIVSKVAVREPVTAKKARLFGVLFKRYGIIPAPFQVYGDYIDKP